MPQGFRYVVAKEKEYPEGVQGPNVMMLHRSHLTRGHAYWQLRKRILMLCCFSYCKHFQLYAFLFYLMLMKQLGSEFNLETD